MSRANPSEVAQAGLLALAYRLGWTVAPRLGRDALARLAGLGGAVMWRRQSEPVRTYRSNLTALTGAPVSDELVRAGLDSATYSLLLSLALGGWTRERIVAAVRTEGEDALRAAVAERGAVVALPHSGSWDLAGAWACATGMPVTTVVERFRGPMARRYDEFVRLRVRLGMEIVADDDPAVLRRLIAAARPGRVVCLLADRDLHGHGVSTRWGSGPAAPQLTMPLGPAVVARRSGAALFPMVASGARPMTITLGAEVPARDGREGLVAMTQAVADFFADRLRRRPEDWHVMVAAFGSAERGPAGAPPPTRERSAVG